LELETSEFQGVGLFLNPWLQHFIQYLQIPNFRHSKLI
jgi:hypothetical protein